MRKYLKLILFFIVNKLLLDIIYKHGSYKKSKKKIRGSV